MSWCPSTLGVAVRASRIVPRVAAGLAAGQQAAAARVAGAAPPPGLAHLWEALARARAAVRELRGPLRAARERVVPTRARKAAQAALDRTESAQTRVPMTAARAARRRGERASWPSSWPAKNARAGTWGG